MNPHTLLRMNDLPELADDAIVAVVVQFNESTLLPRFLEYYRMIGVDHFFFVDNASTDGSMELLQSRKDVTVFRTKDSYKDSAAGLDWSQYILDTYCNGRWSLVVDVDEFLVFPMVLQLGLKKLAKYFEETGADIMWSVMLDMYSTGPLLDSVGFSSFDKSRNQDHYDGAGYRGVPIRRNPFVEVRGGVRERIFWGEKDNKSSPPIKKLPFVKWRLGYQYQSSTHIIHPTLQVADVSSVLLHYKFTREFIDKANAELERGQRWNMGEQYKRYLKPFKDNPNLSFRYKDTKELTGPMRLVQDKMMWFSWNFLRFARGELGDAKATRLAEKTRANQDSFLCDYKDVLSLWPSISNASRQDFMETEVNRDALEVTMEVYSEPDQASQPGFFRTLLSRK